jgi:hypothetical protein
LATEQYDDVIKTRSESRRQERIEELETLLELNATMPGIKPETWAGGKSPKTMTSLMNMLRKNDYVTRERLALAAGIEDKSVDVYMVYVRKFLKQHDIELQTVWGDGYSLSNKDRKKLNQIAAGLTDQTDQTEITTSDEPYPYINVAAEEREEARREVETIKRRLEKIKALKKHVDFSRRMIQRIRNR